MQRIERSRKLQSGVQVIWTVDGVKVSDYFSFEELIDMKVNAFDLLQNPVIYCIEAKEHRIASSV
jgi:hypothetical protein